MTDSPDPSPPSDSPGQPSGVSPEPAYLEYRAPRDDVPEVDSLAPRRPFATRMGVPIGIFYTAAVTFLICAPREWTLLEIGNRTGILLGVFGVLLPAAVALTMKKTRSFGIGILVGLGVLALLLGACYAMSR